MKCKTIKQNGLPCKAHSMREGEHCFRHTQTLKQKALKASSDGGKSKRQYHVLGRRLQIKTPNDIKKLMAKAINSLWTGKMPASNPAGSLGYLSKVFLEAHNQSEIENRLEALEQRLNQAKL